MSKIKNNIKIQWDLSLLYKSVDDPQIEKDIVKAEKAYRAFAKKYTKRTDYLKNENVLVDALKDYKKLSDQAVSKPYYYLYYRQDLNSKDEKVRAKMNLVSQRLQKLGNVVAFFSINLSKIPTSVQKKFLRSKKLISYRYLFKKT